MLKQAERVVLTCHVRPDGDAMGATLGLCRVLRAMGKKARVVTPDLPPRQLSFLPGINDVVAASKYTDFASELLRSADMVFCCDYNKLSRTDALAPLIGASSAKKVLVDHHQSPDPFCDISFSIPEMSSTSELVFRLICALGLFEGLDREGATCLATGIITDTRNLSVNCSDPELYIIMYELLSLGVDKTSIIREALETRTLDSFRLGAFALRERLTLLPKLHAAVITLSADDLRQFNYEKGDTEGLVNEPLKIKGINASYFLREDPDCIKVSARSAGGLAVDRVCENLFGGGGHIQASGGEFHGTLAQAERLLLDALPHYYSPKSQAKE